MSTENLNSKHHTPPIYSVATALVFSLIPAITYSCQLSTLTTQVRQDYAHAYQPQNLVPLGALLLGSGILANTPLDNNIQHAWQHHVRSSFWDKTLHPAEAIGGLKQWNNMVPIYLATYLMSECHSESTDSPLNEFGSTALRTLLLGAPQQAFLTEALGAGRPESGNSHWHPFKHKRAVSGHAFYGAVPFLSMAHLTTGYWKALWYTASTLPALSRVNTDKHYTSQALAGWGIAFVSAYTIHSQEAVDSAMKWNFSKTASESTVSITYLF